MKRTTEQEKSETDETYHDLYARTSLSGPRTVATLREQHGMTSPALQRTTALLIAEERAAEKLPVVPYLSYLDRHRFDLLTEGGCDQ